MQIFFLIIIDKTTFFKYYLNNWMGNSNLIMCPQYPNHSMSGKGTYVVRLNLSARVKFYLGIIT